MRRTLSVTLLASLAILAAACAKGSAAGEAAPAAESPASVENPCAQPAPPQAGEAAACAEGCKWNGTECRQERGIIIHD